MKKPTKALMFYQDWGTYDYRTVVSVNNKTYIELMDSFKQKGSDEVDKTWLEAITDRQKWGDIEKLEKSAHFTTWKDGDDNPYSVLFLPEWKFAGYDYIVLAHELIHAVSFLLSNHMDLMKENEAMAYQHSYLMRSITQRLEKHRGKAKLH